MSRAGRFTSAVLPRNSPDVVRRVLKRFGLPEAAHVRIRFNGIGKSFLPVDRPIDLNLLLSGYLALQDQAKREKDIIRLNCVTDKLVQARVNVNIGEQSMASLQESVTRSDAGESTHEFTRLTIVNQKVTVLGAEAENCIGEDLSFVGATRVDVEVDPNIPQYDPTQPGSPFIDITRPPEASPLS